MVFNVNIDCKRTKIADHLLKLALIARDPLFNVLNLDISW
jgi:hypothetical protein